MSNITMKKTAFVSKSGIKFNCIIQRIGNLKKENVPMLVYLHGGDGVGEDVDKLLRIECLASYLNNGKLEIDKDAVILSPQCPTGTKWYTLEEETIELINFFADEEKVDKNAISLTGCSLGGMGTFSVAIAAPTMFSCIVPVCASVDADKCKVLTNLPVRIFHGELDGGMGFSAVEANCVIKKAGGNSKLTLIPDMGHEIRFVYHDKEIGLVDWMLEQKRNG